MNSRLRNRPALRRVLRSLDRDERGVAIVTVALLGAFLVMLTMLVASQTIRQSRSVDGDRSYEQAIHVAESGTDLALFALDPLLDGLPDSFDDPAEVVGAIDISTLFDVVALPTSPTKADLIAAAEKVAAASPSSVRTTPDGDVVLIAPDDATLIVYSVGFTPSIDDGIRKERVMVLEYYPEVSEQLWDPDLAILSEDDLTLSGGSLITGGAHSNGTMVAGHTNVGDKCATGLDPVVAIGPDCSTTTPVHHPMPAIDPLAAHHRAHYDVCSVSFSFGAGKLSGVYAGPAYPNGDATPATAGEPCSGGLVHANMGLSGVGTRTVTFDKDFNKAGVFYVDGANVVMSSKKDQVRYISILAGTVDGARDCSTSGGAIDASGQAIYHPHADGNNYLWIAGGDMRFNSQMIAHGLLAAHEQIKYNGGIEIFGVLLVEGECDTPGTLSATVTNGSAQITFDGSWTTDFVLKIFEGVEVTRSSEL
ncbi:MAG: hypothetical protein OES13_03995 [Acidimicrobiia bacterium]|nr:hypothetical protein [Acidimicrobiia bacterium]